LFEHFLFQDREIDTNLMYCIAYMVFGNGPACAWATTRQHLFTLVLDVAQAWFTNQIVTGRLVIPPLDFDADSPRHIVEETAAFRSKKGLTVFGHLRSLVRHEEMQRIIARSPAMFTRAAGFLNLFVGMQTQKKEINEHIEFEVDWTKTFAYLGELAKTSRELGESLKFATPDDLLSGLFGVANRVYDDLTLRSSVLDPSKYTPPNFKLVNNVLIPGSQCEIIDVDVSTIEAFSFHHYMNLLFAECLKHLRHIPSDFHNLSLPDFFHKVVLDNIDRTRPEQVIAILVELPMQSELIN
jgi:E3 ubiquitin-protein ligase UBR1